MLLLVTWLATPFDGLDIRVVLNVGTRALVLRCAPRRPATARGRTRPR